MAHRAAVDAGIALHMAERAYEAEHAPAQQLWHDLEEEHYHAYLAGRLTFEGQRRARARDFALAHGEELDELAAGAWFARYFERYRESWSLHDDALPALDALDEALPGVRFGIITNGETRLPAGEARAARHPRPVRPRHRVRRCRHHQARPRHLRAGDGAVRVRRARHRRGLRRRPPRHRRHRGCHGRARRRVAEPRGRDHGRRRSSISGDASASSRSRRSPSSRRSSPSLAV